VRELFDLAGRVALVTGAAGDGYGRQIAEALAEAGARVVITSRRLAKARERARQLTARGLDVCALALDLTRERSIGVAVTHVLKTHGRLDILFNNAAHNHLEPLENVAVKDWNRVLAVNLTGTMLLSRAVAPLLRRGGRGVIVNVSSIYGLVAPDPRLYGRSGLNSPLVYGATKSALVQMTRHLAVEWAPTIRVNCLSAGGLRRGQPPSFLRAYISRTPLGRMAGPDDLKGAAVFLASDASAWMTGQNLVVDGGWTAW